MPSVVIGVLEIDYTVAYPAVSFDLSVVVPDNIPDVGGKKYGLGGTSISLEKRSIRFPISEGPLSGFIELALNPTRTEFTISGEVDLDIKVYSHSWQIGPEAIRYMTPLGLPEPDWSTDPIKIPLEALQAAVNNAPDDRKFSDSGATNLRNDSMTQGLIRGLLTFAGAPDLIHRMIISAKYLGAAFPAQTVQRASVGMAAGGPAQTSAAVPDLLIALSLGWTVGVGVGVSASRGLYVTADGDFGSFGSGALDAGLIAELGAGIMFHLYWADGGKQAKENFSGRNFFVAVDLGDEGLAGGESLYWPENSDLSLSSRVPCGMGLSVGVGEGLPINFYIGNSNTILGVVPPPPKQGPHQL